MAVAVQIVVAATLVLAWVWVLGRPLLSGLAALFARSGDEGRELHDPERQGWPEYQVWPESWTELVRWQAHSSEVKRRQLMLATLFAWFASFLLAIALRGRFVYLFLAMLMVVAVHLAVAAYQGGKLVRARQAARGEVVGPRRAAPGSMTIRASRVIAELRGSQGSHIEAEELLVEYPVEGRGGLHRRHRPPIGGLAEVRGFVEDLIEAEWGPVDDAVVDGPPSLPADSSTGDLESDQDDSIDDRIGSDVEAATGQSSPPARQTSGPADRPVRRRADPVPDGSTAQAAANPAASAQAPAAAEAAAAEQVSAAGDVPTADGPAAQAAQAAQAAGEEPTADGPTEPEAIFTRPAGQVPVRPRRKAKPIYIHSQLDEEGFIPPRAVNQQ